MTVPTDQNPRQTLRPVPPVIPVILAGGAAAGEWVEIVNGPKVGEQVVLAPGSLQQGQAVLVPADP